MVEVDGRVGRVVVSRIHTGALSSGFSTTVMALLRDILVIIYAYALKNTFSYGYKPQMNASITLSIAKSCNITTIL